MDLNTQAQEISFCFYVQNFFALKIFCKHSQLNVHIKKKEAGLYISSD